MLTSETFRTRPVVLREKIGRRAVSPDTIGVFISPPGAGIDSADIGSLSGSAMDGEFRMLGPEAIRFQLQWVLELQGSRARALAILSMSRDRAASSAFSSSRAKSPSRIDWWARIASCNSSSVKTAATRCMK